MNIFKLIALLALMLTIGFATAASAHVVVKPNQVGIGAFQTFSVGVPVEKDIPTTALRLVIPAGLQYVSPNVKPGWKIAVKKSGEGESAAVTEISWTGGSIPAGQRDDFLFSAKVPSSPTSLQWKAYQTYANGTIVAWDVDPSAGLTTFDTSGPYSVTSVVNDLATSTKSSGRDTTALTISICALVLSIVALKQSKKDQTA